MNNDLITPEGYQELKFELEFLLKKEQPKVIDKVNWAASLGDRKENADYFYNKKLLNEINKKIFYLKKALETSKIVEYSPKQEGKVFFGAWVEIKNEKEKKINFRIVGSKEIYKFKNYISINSPMARSLINKSVNEKIQVNTPSGTCIWYITSIYYNKKKEKV